MEWLMEKLDIVLILVCTNILLTAVSSVLDKVKDKTVTDADNKASDFMHKYLGYLKTAIDWLTGNKEH